MKRIENMNWAMKPMVIQTSSVVGVDAHQISKCANVISTTRPL